MMGGHVRASDADHDLLDENESRVYNNMDSDEEREAYLQRCFEKKSMLARRSEHRLR